MLDLCKQCDASFTPNRPWQKYCSALCRDQRGLESRKDTPASRAVRARSQGRVRGISVSVTADDIAAVHATHSHRCYYCGGSLPRQGTGLDRLDSSRGYELDNVVACCRSCNMAKKAVHHDAYMGHLIREAFYRTSGPGGES